jgi:hypothetical protein
MTPCSSTCPNGECANCVGFGSPSSKPLSCMGGFGCTKRGSCSHYHAEERDYPAERLCAPGTHDCWQPVSVVHRHEGAAA